MYSHSYKTDEPELKLNISQILNNKDKYPKKHLDSLSCLINCTETKIILHITQKPGNGKDNLFLVQKGDNFSTLFFYDIPSDQVLDEIQNKNEAQKLLNNNQKINTENEVIDKFEQNKKNKILLFNYIKFPLININAENNIKKKSTIIILDNGENDIISNFNTNSSFFYNRTCSIALTINNPNNCDFLFSLSDIKNCKEIKIKLSGTVHSQPLFDKEIICYLSPDIIINSIKQRMDKYEDNEDIEKLKDKYFFTKLNDDNYNNIGILFSLIKKKDPKEVKYDKEYLKSDKYMINKIFLFLDMWFNEINMKNTILSTDSSSKVIINKYEEKNKYNAYSNEHNYYIEKEAKSDYNCYKNNIEYKLNNEIKNSDTKNKDYFSNNRDYSDYNYSISNAYDNYTHNNSYKYDTYSKSNSQNYNFYYNEEYKDSELNKLFNLVKNVQKSIIDDKNKKKLEKSDDREKLNILLIKLQLENNYITSEEEKQEDIYINKTLFINMNEEMMRKLFDKYEQDKCISNYTIIKNMLDININISPNDKRISEMNITYFLELFQNSNHININIPFITKKGKLIINSFNPSLSSMFLLFKSKKKAINHIKKNMKKYKYEGFNFHIDEKYEKIVKLEYEEVKPVHERDLLYIKIAKIKNIINDAKIKYKNILIKNSYFSVLWSITNNINIKSSFLAYYSFDFKLIGILIINLDYNKWLTPFSYKLENHRDYKADYDKNVDEVKKLFENLSIDKENKNLGKYFKYDYYSYLSSNKRKNY